jgi:two-component system, OmpR family, sensor histidine kinase CpxA
MPRLFWKLFMSYWLALILFSAGLLLSASVYLEHIRAMHDEAHNTMGFKERAQSARDLAAKQGLPGLTAWAEQVDQEELLPILVLDKKGQDLLQRAVSGVALSHLHRHQAMVRAKIPDNQTYHAVTLADGTEYWMVPDSVGVTLNRLLTRPRVILVPLILASLIGAIVCLLLAYYLASPIRRIRHAAIAYASGDLSHRVAPSMGSRRDEIVDLAIAMDDMAGHLDALLESKRSLLRDISHELRSPLARVQLALGLARQRCNASGEALDPIQHEVTRLNDLIGAILTFSRVDSGLQPIQHEYLELSMLIAEAAKSTQLECSPRNVQVEVETVSRGDYTGSPMLLYSAIENVLRNAANYAPDNSKISVRLEEIVDANNEHEYRIQISDQGHGVPEAMLTEIFRPFIRVEETFKGGMGLGLAISQRIVQACNGRIHAENVPEGGLRVSIHLPRVPC